MSLHEILADGSPLMRLAERFVAAGHQFYLVGGPVRDAFLGRPSPDYDFATDATPQDTAKIVKPTADNVWMQGARFGTVGARIDGFEVEITTFRTEKYQPASRHPDVRFASDIETDLQRRDFTVNAMAVRLPDKEAVDPYGGLEDLKRELLRTPQDPLDSFGDDPLRMLRAFRFMSQLGFEIETDTYKGIVELADRIETISAERIRDELSKLLVGEHAGKAMKRAYESGLTEYFLPEMSALKLEQDPEHHHKDVFEHTLKVVDRTEPILPLRLAALLHDIGKPATRRIMPDKGVTFYHHEVVGARMASERLKALRFPNAVIDEVVHLVAMHQRFHGYGDEWTDSAVRRYVRDAGPYLGHLNKLVRADCTTRNAAKAKQLAERVDHLDERIAELAEHEQLSKIRPELNGNEVMEYLGLAPGPQVGEAMDFLLEIRLEEGEVGKDELYRRLDEWAKERGLR